MDIEEIVKQVKKILNSNTSSNLSNEKSKEAQSDEVFSFQNPIKSDYKNIGDFGVTNPRHPTGHQGIDIAAPKGTPIFPTAPGKVTRVANEGKGGLVVYIQHKDGYRSFYAHLDSTSVNVGDVVNNTTKIGTVGNTGNANITSPHLHFQVWKDNKIINPASLFSFKKYNQ